MERRGGALEERGKEKKGGGNRHGFRETWGAERRGKDHMQAIPVLEHSTGGGRERKSLRDTTMKASRITGRSH